MEAVDVNFCTPLHLAALQGHGDAVETLLRHGASVAAVDEALCTPLHFAAAEGHRNIAAALIRVSPPSPSSSPLTCCSPFPSLPECRAMHSLE